MGQRKGREVRYQQPIRPNELPELRDGDGASRPIGPGRSATRPLPRLRTEAIEVAVLCEPKRTRPFGDPDSKSGRSLPRRYGGPNRPHLAKRGSPKYAARSAG